MAMGRAHSRSEGGEDDWHVGREMTTDAKLGLVGFGIVLAAAVIALWLIIRLMNKGENCE